MNQYRVEHEELSARTIDAASYEIKDGWVVFATEGGVTSIPVEGITGVYPSHCRPAVINK